MCTSFLDGDSDDNSDVISCHNYQETSSSIIEVGNGDGSQMTLTGPMVQNTFVDQEWLLAETFLDDDLKFSFLDDNEVTSDDALSCPNYQESPSTLLPASAVWHHFYSSGIRRTSLISIEVGNTDGLRVPYAAPTVPYPQHPDAQKPSLLLSSRLSFGELLSFGTISHLHVHTQVSASFFEKMLLSWNMGYARTLLEPMFTFEPTYAQLSRVSTEFSALHNNAKTTAQHSFLATILTTQVHVIFYSSLGPNSRFQIMQSNQVSSHSYIFFLAAVGLSENKMCYNLLLCSDNY